MKNFNLDSNAKFTTRSFYVGVGWGGIQIRIQSLSSPWEVLIWGWVGIQTQIRGLRNFVFMGGRRNPDSNPILSSPQEVSIWGRGTGIQTQVQSLSFFYDKFNSTWEVSMRRGICSQIWSPPAGVNCWIPEKSVVTKVYSEQYVPPIQMFFFKMTTSSNSTLDLAFRYLGHLHPDAP